MSIQNTVDTHTPVFHSTHSQTQETNHYLNFNYYMIRWPNFDMRNTILYLQRCPLPLRFLLCLTLPLYAGVLLGIFSISNPHRPYLFVNRQDWIVLASLSFTFQLALVLVLLSSGGYILFWRSGKFEMWELLLTCGIGALFYTAMVLCFIVKDYKAMRGRRRLREEFYWARNNNNNNNSRETVSRKEEKVGNMTGDISLLTFPLESVDSIRLMSREGTGITRVSNITTTTTSSSSTTINNNNNNNNNSASLNTPLRHNARHTFDETEPLSIAKAELVLVQLLSYVECRSYRILWGTLPISIIIVFILRMCLLTRRECKAWNLMLDSEFAKQPMFWLRNFIWILLIFSLLTSTVWGLVTLYQHVQLLRCMANMKLWYKQDKNSSLTKRQQQKQKQQQFFIPSSTLNSINMTPELNSFLRHPLNLENTVLHGEEIYSNIDYSNPYSFLPQQDNSEVEWGRVAHGWNDLARPEHMLLYFHVFKGIMDEVHTKSIVSAFCASCFFLHIILVLSLTSATTFITLHSLRVGKPIMFPALIPILFIILFSAIIVILFIIFAGQLEAGVAAQIKRVSAVQADVQKQIDRHYYSQNNNNKSKNASTHILLNETLPQVTQESLECLQAKVMALAAVATFARSYQKQPSPIGLSLAGVRWLSLFILLGALNGLLAALNIVVCL